MQSIRCRCGKIVCQVEKLPGLVLGEGVPESLATPAVVILCRHCKRHVVLHVLAAYVIHYGVNEGKAREAPYFSTGL